MAPITRASRASMPGRSPLQSEDFPAGLPRTALVQTAYALAAEAHAGQLRKGSGDPYLNHLIRVASRVADAALSTPPGYPPDIPVAAALLHDTLEDTLLDAPTLRGELAVVSGEDVAGLVLDAVESLTQSTAGNRAARIRDMAERIRHAPAWVQTVKAEDRIDNLADMRLAKPAFWGTYREETRVLREALAAARPSSLAVLDDLIAGDPPLDPTPAGPLLPGRGELLLSTRTGSPYLALTLSHRRVAPFLDGLAAVPHAARDDQARCVQRNRGGYHITLVSADLWAAMNVRGRKRAHADVLGKDFRLVPSGYYSVIHPFKPQRSAAGLAIDPDVGDGAWLLSWRRAQGLPPADLHLTLALGPGGDVSAPEIRKTATFPLSPAAARARPVRGSA